MLFDTHAHLDDPKLAEDQQAVIARAREAGVGLIVNAAENVNIPGRPWNGPESTILSTGRWGCIP